MNPGRRVLDWIEYRLWVLRRATLVPALMRLTVGVAGLGGLSAGFFSSVLPPTAYLGFAVLALMTALLPRTLLPTAMIFLAAFGWLTSGVDYGAGAGFVRLWLLSVLLYVMHSAAAMAAVLPYDALVMPGTLRSWRRRGVAVTILTGVVALGVAELPDLVHGPRQVLGSVIGLAVTLAIAGYLTVLGRRGGEPPATGGS